MLGDMYSSFEQSIFVKVSREACRCSMAAGDLSWSALAGGMQAVGDVVRYMAAKGKQFR
jgi:hypothetical protein